MSQHSKASELERVFFFGRGGVSVRHIGGLFWVYWGEACYSERLHMFFE